MARPIKDRDVAKRMAVKAVAEAVRRILNLNGELSDAYSALKDARRELRALEDEP